MCCEFKYEDYENFIIFSSCLMHCFLNFDSLSCFLDVNITSHLIHHTGVHEWSGEAIPKFQIK